jgi:hypothetical protein
MQLGLCSLGTLHSIHTLPGLRMLLGINLRMILGRCCVYACHTDWEICTHITQDLLRIYAVYVDAVN